jgi:hypothetical protein
MLLLHLPELGEDDVWRSLSLQERDMWHVALGTATIWFGHEVRVTDQGGGLLDAYAALLEELAAIGDRDFDNVVVLDALELLDFEDPKIQGLLERLGPRTRELLSVMNRLGPWQGWPGTK